MTLLFGHFVTANCPLTQVFWHCVEGSNFNCCTTSNWGGIVIRLKRKRRNNTIYFDDEEWLLCSSVMKPFRDVCPKVPAFAQLLIFPPLLWWLFLHCDFHFKIAAVLPSLCRSSDPDNNVWSRRLPDIINNPAIRPRWPMPSCSCCYRHFLNRHSSGATDWKKPK